METKSEYEIKEARKAYKSLIERYGREELEKNEKPMRWEDLKSVGGFCVDGDSSISQLDDWHSCLENKKVFRTKKQAESSLAKAQLSQLMWIWNGLWEPDWCSNTQMKSFIGRKENSLITGTNTFTYEFLSFRAPEIRNEFLNNFEELIRQYFEL